MCCLPGLVSFVTGKLIFIILYQKSNQITPTQPLRATLGAESRVYYPVNTGDRQTQWALTYCHLSQSTANQNGKLIHCHHWDLNSWSSGCWRTFLTTRPCPIPQSNVGWMVGCGEGWVWRMGLSFVFTSWEKGVFFPRKCLCLWGIHLRRVPLTHHTPYPAFTQAALKGAGGRGVLNSRLHNYGLRKETAYIMYLTIQIPWNAQHQRTVADTGWKCINFATMECLQIHWGWRTYYNLKNFAAH
jgi:hypothetical protein